MSVTVVRSQDVAPQPWRNGGGVTRELIAWPSPADWRVRISIADIERDGPFSAYAGVQRWFTVLKGAGVVLTLDGVAQRLTRSDAPFGFDGAASVDCRLIDGPTRDLNLMLRGTSGTMQIAEDGAPWQPQAARCGLFTAVAGCCSDGTQQLELPAYALAWFDPAPATLRFTAGERPAGAIGWWLAAAPAGAPA
jgi:uncharacterized protein